MPNYVKTGSFTNGGAPGISAQFLNNIENVFQQPSGGTETGQYFVQFGAYQTNATGSIWVSSLSRGRAPLSVSIDQSITNAGVSGTSVNYSSSNGFSVTTSATGPSNTARVGGGYTINY